MEQNNSWLVFLYEESFLMVFKNEFVLILLPL